MRISRKHYIVAIAVVLLLSALFFRPRPLRQTLPLTQVDLNGDAYCTMVTLSSGKSHTLSGPGHMLFGPGHDFFGPLLDQVVVVGPFFYKNGAVNPQLVNLYLALPNGDGTYRQITVELLLEHSTDGVLAQTFVNVDGRGYWVVSGHEALVAALQSAGAYAVQGPAG